MHWWREKEFAKKVVFLCKNLFGQGNEKPRLPVGSGAYNQVRYDILGGVTPGGAFAARRRTT